MLSIQAKSDRDLDNPTSGLEQKEQFMNKVIHEAALASNNYKDKHFDFSEAKHQSGAAMTALNVTSGLQAMLTAQMLSIHQLQQKVMAYANAIDDLRLGQYYTNSAIKLAKCFVQQTNILAKLQGIGGQKIIVERVDVHDGGQAIVGCVQGSDYKK